MVLGVTDVLHDDINRIEEDATVTVHESYHSWREIEDGYLVFKKYNDIAVLTMDNKVNFNQFIRTIALPLSETVMYDGSDVMISGWGEPEGHSPKQSKFTQHYMTLIWAKTLIL